jgi:hypothetical protein
MQSLPVGANQLHPKCCAAPQHNPANCSISFSKKEQNDNKSFFESWTLTNKMITSLSKKDLLSSCSFFEKLMEQFDDIACKYSCFLSFFDVFL